MSNTLLTSTQVTRKALMILHQKLNFVGSINRGYDDSFAKDGAKIGDTLKIRVPNQYTVRSGATLSAQDVAESSVSLQVGTQKGVDVNFTSYDLTLMGGSSKSIEDKTVTNTVDPMQMQQYQDNYARAQQTTASLTPYTGQITAGFNLTQLQAQGLFAGTPDKLSAQFFSISKDFHNAIQAKPLPVDCVPDAERLRRLTQAVAAANSAAGSQPGASVPTAP